MKFFIVLFAILLISSLLFFFLFFDSTQAQDGEGGKEEEEDDDDECDPCYDYYYYCDPSGCGGTLIEEECEECCGGGCSTSIMEECGSWQICDDSALTCSCQGECLETPQQPRYYDNPTYSDQQDKDVGNEDVRLPVKLDWDDVPEWKAAPDGPQSYKIQINNTTQNPFAMTLDKSEFIPDSCLLKSKTTHGWQAQACCTADGQNCGPPSNWQLTTNLAPEPVSPIDPDWQGQEKAENTPIPITLDWCDVEEAGSYRLRPFLLEDDKQTCHPALRVGDQCDSWWLKKERRDPEQIEKTLYSDFTDKDRYFFTKDTTYWWEMLTCDDDGVNCGEPGQRWSFPAIGEVPEKVILLSPPHDPDGNKPVGLPLILDWSAPVEMKSFLYQLKPISATAYSISHFTQVSQSESLNISDLSLDALYKWRVKGCWDYWALDCEENFSQESVFRTTGRPPSLEYPSAGAQNIPIPANLIWEDVPGAKSYVLKIWGDRLNITTSTEKSGFSVDYPKLPIYQETSYSWQVKTCAWENGWACGQYSSPRGFTTFKLPPPTNPLPKDGGKLSTDERYVSWEKVPEAKAYQYKIKYLAPAATEENEECRALTGQEVIPIKTVPTDSDYVQLNCLGEYQWQAVSCLGQNCTQSSSWSGPWTFNLVEPTGISLGGLVPCGRAVDNPKTPWNEREPCQIKHISLLFKIIIDFLLWRVAPVILVLLVVASGVIFYFSLPMGAAEPIARIRSLWKSAGLGFGLIFFAWTIVNLLLKFAGYQIGIFGNWYQL